MQFCNCFRNYPAVYKFIPVKSQPIPPARLISTLNLPKCYLFQQGLRMQLYTTYMQILAYRNIACEIIIIYRVKFHFCIREHNLYSYNPYNLIVYSSVSMSVTQRQIHYDCVPSINVSYVITIIEQANTA